MSSFRFDLAPGPQHSQKEPEAGWKILLLADLSGRGERSNTSALPLRDRPRRRLDFDTFETVFAKSFPSLQILHDGEDLNIAFDSIEDFHPDAVFDRLEVFAALRDLRSRLESPQTFASAIADLKGRDSDSDSDSSGARPRVDSGTAASAASSPPQGQNDFSRLLGGTPSSKKQNPPTSTSASSSTSASPPSSVDSFLQRLVAPHITPEMADQPAYLAIVDQAIHDVMKALLHHPSWQALEGTWRSLQGWTQDSNLDERIELRVLDLTRNELRNELGQGNLNEGELHAILEGASSGGESFDLILANFSFGEDVAGLTHLASLGALGARLGAPIMAAASPSLLGGNELTGNTEHLSASQEVQDFWAALRESPVAAWIGLVAPRLLLRLPYGERTDPTERFRFEESTNRFTPSELLFGPGVMAVAQALLASQLGTSTGDILEDVPVVTFTDSDGELQMGPPAEVFLSERVRDQWVDRGLTPLVSVKGRNHVQLPRIQSIARPASRLGGRFR